MLIYFSPSTVRKKQTEMDMDGYGNPQPPGASESKVCLQPCRSEGSSGQLETNTPMRPSQLRVAEVPELQLRMLLELGLQAQSQNHESVYVTQLHEVTSSSTPA